MKRLLLTGSIVGLTACFLWTPAEPAGACSIACMEGRVQIELVEVRRVEAADPTAETPELPVVAEFGSIDQWGNAWFDDNTWLSLADEPLRDEVTR